MEVSNVVSLCSHRKVVRFPAIRAWVQSHLPRSETDEMARARAALELRHWAETTTKQFGAETAVDLLRHQLSRAEARREGGSQ